MFPLRENFPDMFPLCENSPPPRALCVAVTANNGVLYVFSSMRNYPQ